MDMADISGDSNRGPGEMRATASSAARATASVKASTITWASGLYLRAAKHFATLATTLDDPARTDGKEREDVDSMIAELVNVSLATVMIANSAIERPGNDLLHLRFYI
jgi:hypothetical protein